MKSIAGNRNAGIQKCKSRKFYYHNISTNPNFSGKKDRTVDISQSELLQKKLQAAGVKNKLVVYDRVAHGWYGALLSDSYDKIENFSNHCHKITHKNAGQSPGVFKIV